MEISIKLVILRVNFQDKLEKMKVALSRLEAEKRNLQEELSRAENRSTKLELQRMSAEGDLQRLQMMLQEKDATIQVLLSVFDSMFSVFPAIKIIRTQFKFNPRALLFHCHYKRYRNHLMYWKRAKLSLNLI